MKTTTRYIPEGYKLLKETPNTTVYGGELRPGRFAAIGFIRKSNKPTFHYGFPRLDDMTSHIETFTDRVEKNLEARAKAVIARKERQATEIANVKVGDLFAYSWGYDQTNVNFFEVIEKKPKSFVVREIASRQVSNDAGGPMSADVTPVPGAFLEDSKPIAKTSFSMPFGILYKTEEGKKHYSSWYA